MKHVRIKNWEEYQQYKDRDPKWIKLHRSLLDNYEYTHLTDIQKSHLIGLWLLAAKLDNKIPSDPKWIADRIAATSKIDLKPLFDADFIELYNDVRECTEPYESVPREEKSKGEQRKGYGELGKVILSDDEYATLLTKHGQTTLNKGIEKLDTYIASKNAKYASHYAVMKSNSWVWDGLTSEGNKASTAEVRT